MGCHYFCQGFYVFEEIHIFVSIWAQCNSFWDCLSTDACDSVFKVWPKLHISESRIKLLSTFWNSVCILSAHNAFKSCRELTTFMFMHLADAFIKSDLQAIHFCQYVCVPLGIEPKTFLRCLIQCSTTETLDFETEPSFKYINVYSLRVIRCYHNHSLFKELTHLNLSC